MGLIDRIADALGLHTEAEISEARNRAYEAGFYDANDEPPTSELKSYGYRRQTVTGLRDFTKMSHDKIIEVVWVLYQSNPLARRYLQIKRDYILGRGIKPVAEDEALKEVIDAFFTDNDLHSKLNKVVSQLFLWGEQILVAAVREADGAVRLGYIDPAEVEQVVTHPENAMEPWAVVCKQRPDKDKRVYRIIRKDAGYSDNGKRVKPQHEGLYVTASQAARRPWEERLLKDAGCKDYAGSVFYFAINNVSNQPRGFSDLLQVADWLDSHDETLFALADREQFANYFSWDVAIENADESYVKQRANEIRMNPPKKGSANVHNTAETWTFNYPDLKQPGSIASADAIETHALGGLGLPRHWYAHGDGTNRATAMAQGDPTYKTLQSDQDTVKEFILSMLCFVRDQAEIAGYWRAKAKNDEARQVDVMMPEMAQKDLGQITTTLSQLTNALATIVTDLKLITKDTAAKAIAKVLAEMDVEYDPVEELEKAQKEAEEAAEKQEQQQGQKQNDMMNKAIAKNGKPQDEEEEQPAKEWYWPAKGKLH